ncbi:MAG TPA: response regulator transcription factor [Blastocatellia bacterium]|nr:response regulator transcription factor [Blastocatellia bacterium]
MQTGTHNINLFIVDDYELFREGLSALLERVEGLRLVGVLSMSADAIERIKLIGPDIVLVCTTSSEYNALELIGQISLRFPQVKSIAVGLNKSESSIQKCLGAGASGYISKGESIGDLLSLIISVNRNESAHRESCYYTPLPTGRPTQGDAVAPGPEVIDLSARELEVLQLITEGHSNGQIADKLCISLHTAKNHVHNILEKLCAHSRSEAVYLALQKGLLTMAPSTAAEYHKD